MKPTVVILHGWGLSQKKFEPLIIEMKQRGYPVVSLDFPGFGESKPPARPMTLDDYARFLHTFLTQQRVSNPIFIGHSFGGRVSLRYQILYPKSVRALILTGTPGFTPVANKKLILFIAFAKVGKLLFSLPVLSMFMEKVQAGYYYLVGAKEFYRAKGAMKQTFKNIVKEPLLEDMKLLTVPCLLLWGENDTIVPVAIAERMKQTISGSTLTVIPDSNHRVPYQDPQRFADAVESFISIL